MEGQDDTQNKKRKLEPDTVPPESTEQVKDMLLLFSHQECINLLATLGSQSGFVLSAIRERVNQDPKMRKLFVRSLAFSTTDETLRASFEPFGSVTEAVVIMNKMEQKSKGFGFVTFEDAAAAQRALQEPNKEIDGRQTVCNLAAKKAALADLGVTPAATTSSFGGGGGSSASNATGTALTKLFVRSLSYDTSTEALTKFFVQYGEITEAVVLTNRETGASKGYGFVTYADVASASNALMEPEKQLDGRTIHCKLAAKPDEGRPQPAPQYNANAQFGGGGFGGAMNGYGGMGMAGMMGMGMGVGGMGMGAGMGGMAQRPPAAPPTTGYGQQPAAQTPAYGMQQWS